MTTRDDTVEVLGLGAVVRFARRPEWTGELTARDVAWARLSRMSETPMPGAWRAALPDQVDPYQVDPTGNAYRLVVQFKPGTLIRAFTGTPRYARHDDNGIWLPAEAMHPLFEADAVNGWRRTFGVYTCIEVE